MVFDEEPRVARRIRQRRDIYERDNFYRPPDLAPTPTEMWFEPDPARRLRRTYTAPRSYPEFPFQAPFVIGATPSTFWIEQVFTPQRRRPVRSPEFRDAHYPFPIPPVPPVPPPPIIIAQRLYAKTSSLYQPAFAPIFPFLGPSAVPLFVGDQRGVRVAVRASVTVSLFIDLSPTMGRAEMIAEVFVQLLEAGGVDANPASRLLGAPVIGPAMGRARQGITQLLNNLLNEGQYIVIVTSHEAGEGGWATFAAPFAVA